MESFFVFYMSFYSILFHFLVFNEATPWARRHCQQITKGYDCNDMDLQSIPDEIPNSVQILQFSFNYLPALYNSTFQRLKSLRSLDVTRCSITFIYEDVFTYQPHLEVLLLTGNPLVFIASTAFSGPLALKYLSLVQSKIKQLSDIPSENLAYLEVLDLRGSNIRSLNGLSNFRWQNLKSLQLDLNFIDRISFNDLQPFSNLAGVSISFKGNDFIYIEPGAFHSLNLSSLDFSGCLNKMNISSLLKGLEGIKTNRLNLGLYETDSNVYIASAALQSFCNIFVSDLDFQLQHFLDLNNSTFHCLEGLKKLDLTRAHLNALPLNTTGLSTLSHLILDENQFKDVCQSNTRNFPMLTHLSISGNLKKLTFSNRCLDSLGLLEELDLSVSLVNPREPCCNNQLFGLGELKLLNLSYGSPMFWSSKPFNVTPKLEHLDFSHSVYTLLNDSSPFSNLQSLRTLNLSWSNTDLTNVHLFVGLKALQHLNLRGNAIQGEVLTQTELFKCVPLLETLVLSACKITSFDENLFKGLRHLNHIDLSENKFVKLSTSGFYSLDFLKLNFARNDITTVDVASVADLGEEGSVDLSYNPLVCNCSNFEFIHWVKKNKVKVKHLMETFCNGTGTRIIDAKLQCDLPVGVLVFCAVLAAVLLASAIFLLIRRVRKYSIYTNL
ncbi:CD180 antigen precursor [Danio rerio]|uniref:CD180 antigen precursor n=1 Tax=Danio rerio TaxID=7955 RepID=A0A8M1P6U9_DANRE|nr:CD180 antigen precursor [Danio rerio]|eukprot:NP_001297419.1 CD180 antigen precursor [Danio rerio]